MRVHLQRERRRRVPEEFLNQSRGIARGQPEGSGAVPEVVNPDSRETRLADEAVELPPDVALMEDMAVSLRGHEWAVLPEVGIPVPEHSPGLLLSRPEGAQFLDEDRRDGENAVGLLGLRLAPNDPGLHAPLPGPVDDVERRKNCRVSAIRPEPAKLAWGLPRFGFGGDRHRQVVGGIRMLAAFFKEHAQLFRRLGEFP